MNPNVLILDMNSAHAGSVPATHLAVGFTDTQIRQGHMRIGGPLLGASIPLLLLLGDHWQNGTWSPNSYDHAPQSLPAVFRLSSPSHPYPNIHPAHSYRTTRVCSVPDSAPGEDAMMTAEQTQPLPSVMNLMSRGGGNKIITETKYSFLAVSAPAESCLAPAL